MDVLTGEGAPLRLHIQYMGADFCAMQLVQGAQSWIGGLEEAPDYYFIP